MHPLLADLRKLLAYLLACLAAGIGIAGLMRLGGLGGWFGTLAFAVPLTIVFGFVALSSYYLCRSQPQAQRRWVPVSLMFLGASLLSALAWLGLAEAWNVVGRFGPQETPFVAFNATGRVLFFAGGFGLYLLSLLANDVLVAFENVEAAARREAESRVLARDAELQMLRTQINPHFLFNSLNSISALTGSDPKAAREMTIDLAQFFRRTLALAERERIPLGDEVALCTHFLAIEQRRFGPKLRSDWRIAADAAACLLPPMALQPLVENAIKHGIRGLADGGTIAISVSLRDGWLHVSVANPVAPGDAGAASREAGQGLGLRNLRERLAVLYGDRGRITWQRTDASFTTEIAVPAEMPEAAPR